MNRPSPMSRTRAGLAALALAAALSACATQPSGPASARSVWPQASDAAPAEAGFTAQGLAALDARLKQAVDRGELAGIVHLTARNGEIAQFSAHGVRSLETGAPMTTDTLFRINSMTKPVTAVAMMQLYEKGLWSLDDPITKHAPEFAGLKVYRNRDRAGKLVLVNPDRPATMRELMAHTAGFGYGLTGGNPVDDAFRNASPLSRPGMKEMMADVAEIPLLTQPGERWSYSIASDIQGAIVERLSGQTLGDYLKANIFTPLNMSDTRFVVAESDRKRLADIYQWDARAGRLVASPDARNRDVFTADHVESGGAGLVSTAHDYARFCQMLLQGGELAGRRLLKPETVALMTRNHIGDLRLYSDGTPARPGLPGTGFGFGFAVITDPAALASPQGAGTYYWSGVSGTWFWIDPKNNLFFIGLVQRRGGAGADAINIRGDATRLVYEALAPTQGAN